MAKKMLTNSRSAQRLIYPPFRLKRSGGLKKNPYYWVRYILGVLAAFCLLSFSNDLIAQDVIKGYNLTLENQTINEIIDFIARNSITAGPSFTIEPPSEVKFKAGREIRLQDGFHAKTGSQFIASIDNELKNFPPEDLNSDGCVDRADLSIILADIRGPEPHEPFFDLNHDGEVNIADARYLVTLFTNPRGEPCQ